MCLGLFGLALAACEAPGEEEAQADCSLLGEFAVELGDGHGAFMGLEDGASPELIHGIQGGTHLILGAWVHTPDPLERYTLALLAEVGQEPCDVEGCASWTLSGELNIELDGSFDRLALAGPGEVEIHNLFLVVNAWEAAPHRRLRLDVWDACDRHASSVRTFANIENAP